MDRDEEFVAFASRASAGLVRLGYLLTGDYDLAKDVTQETLARMYVAWPKIRDQGRVHAYARTTMTRQVHDWRRRHRMGFELPTAELDNHNSSADPAIDLANSMALLAAVRSLEPRERTVIVLRYYEDLSEIQTAETMRCSVSAVKSLTHRAMTKLRRYQLDSEDTVATKGKGQS